MIGPFEIAVIIVLVIAMALSLAWVARDATRRQRSPWLVALLCLITWPLGLLFWRMVRPPPTL